MSKASNNSPLRGMKGKIGSLVTRELRGKTVVSMRTRPTKKATHKQKKNRGNFADAAAEAKAMTRDPGVKEYFKMIAKDKKLPNAYTAAVQLIRQLQKKEAEELGDAKGIKKQRAAAKKSVEEKHSRAVIDAFKKSLDAVKDALYQISQIFRNLENSTTFNTDQKNALRLVLNAEIRKLL